MIIQGNVLKQEGLHNDVFRTPVSLSMVTCLVYTDLTCVTEKDIILTAGVNYAEICMKKPADCLCFSFFLFKTAAAYVQAQCSLKVCAIPRA